MSNAVPPGWPEERKRLLHEAFNDRLAAAIDRLRIWNTLVLLAVGLALVGAVDQQQLWPTHPVLAMLVAALPVFVALAALFSARLHLRLLALGAVFAGSMLIVGSWLLAITTRAERLNTTQLITLLCLLAVAIAGVITALRHAQLELRRWFERGPANLYERAPAASATLAWTRPVCAIQIGLWCLLFVTHQIMAAQRSATGLAPAADVFETIPGILCALTAAGVLIFGLWGPYRPLTLVSIGAAGMSGLWALWFTVVFWLPIPGVMPTAVLSTCCARHGNSILRACVLAIFALAAAAVQPAAVKLIRATLKDFQLAHAAQTPAATPADEAITTENWDEAKELDKD